MCGPHAPGSSKDISASRVGAKGKLEQFDPILALMEQALDDDAVIDLLIDQKVRPEIAHANRRLRVPSFWRRQGMVCRELGGG